MRRPLLLPLALVGLSAAAFVIARSWFGPPEEPAERPTRTTGFEDTATAAGISFHMSFLPSEQGERFRINLYDHGAGVAVGDYDGDGRDDVYFCNQLGPNALYRNEGGGKFKDVTKEAGADIGLGDRISVCAAFGDYDNDGRQDLFVTTTRGGNALFHNLGNGTFEDVTKRAGVTLVAHSQGAAFFDADGDGFPDLLVTNTAQWTTNVFDRATNHYEGLENILVMWRQADSTKEKNRFYRNRGNGTFEDATEASGLGGVGWGGDTAVFDYDEDGDLDVLVGNMFGSSILFQNDGKGHFHDVTREVLKKTSYGTLGARAFDYDGDGRLDLFLVDMHSDMWTKAGPVPSPLAENARVSGPWGPKYPGTAQQEREALEGLGLERGRGVEFVFGNTLFKNLGGGRFEETSERAGVETLWPWGIAAGDFDADGNEDAYLPSGMGYPFAYLRSPLLMNLGNGTFVDRSREAGLDPLPGGDFLPTKIGDRPAARSSRSAATADFDGDGRLDVVVNNFNDVPFLLMNRWPRRHWAEFRLTGDGKRSNRDAIGALVRLQVGNRTYVRQVQAAGGYLAQSSNTLHFGLGDATRIDRCEVRWPSGAVDRFTDLPVDRRSELRETPR